MVSISLINQYHAARGVLAVVLMVCLSLTKGVGFLLILPLLQLIGFDTQPGTGGGITQAFSAHVNHVGLPVTLIIVVLYVLIVSLYALLNHWQNTTVKEGLQVGKVFSNFGSDRAAAAERQHTATT